MRLSMTTKEAASTGTGLISIGAGMIDVLLALKTALADGVVTPDEGGAIVRTILLVFGVIRFRKAVGKG